MAHLTLYIPISTFVDYFRLLANILYVHCSDIMYVNIHKYLHETRHPKSKSPFHGFENLRVRRNTRPGCFFLLKQFVWTTNSPTPNFSLSQIWLLPNREWTEIWTRMWRTGWPDDWPIFRHSGRCWFWANFSKFHTHFWPTCFHTKIIRIKYEHFGRFFHTSIWSHWGQLGTLFQVKMTTTSLKR
jgi:hypothetical protein